MNEHSISTMRKVLELRTQGLNYYQIAKELGMFYDNRGVKTVDFNKAKRCVARALKLEEDFEKVKESLTKLKKVEGGSK